MLIKNRKASYDYTFLERETAGISLTGSEVKSLRSKESASISEAYVYIQNGEIFIQNMNISVYTNGGYANHEPTRLRRLLMTKKQIQRWEKETAVRGITIIPVKAWFNDDNIFKVELALCKGNTNFDKRNNIKRKDIEREEQRRF
jgi:SsrA-binding protein